MPAHCLGYAAIFALVCFLLGAVAVELVHWRKIDKLTGKENKMQEWISVKDNLPEHGQHVLVWDVRDNVFPFPGGVAGDDGNGRVQMGDAIFFCGDIMWNETPDKHRWKGADDFKSINGWHEWEGQGPCSFDSVTHWQPLPDPPK